VCRKCCKGGDGNPECKIRKCCQKKGVDLCFECPEFPCGEVKDDKKMIARAREYKKLGRSEWLRRQVKKAKQGFELHTGKFYEIQVEECPPPQKSNTNKR
jgi:hypothetical protein